MEKALEVDAPQVTHGHLVKTMRGWESKAVAIEDLEKLVQLHRIGLVGELTSFAAGYAHEVATGVELRCFTERAFGEIKEKREALGRARTVLRIFKGRRRGKVRQLDRAAKRTESGG